VAIAQPAAIGDYRKNPLTIVEILAEAALIDLPGQIAISRGDDPNVDVAGMRVADAFQLRSCRTPSSFACIDWHVRR
jgi:hypothetical protein